jgi:hypothetical protein
MEIGSCEERNFSARQVSFQPAESTVLSVWQPTTVTRRPFVRGTQVFANAQWAEVDAAQLLAFIPKGVGCCRRFSATHRTVRRYVVCGVSNVRLLLIIGFGGRTRAILPVWSD